MEENCSKEKLYSMSDRFHRGVVPFLSLLLTLCVLLSACGGRSAVRHAEGDVGYIPTSASPVSVEGVEADAFFIYDYAAEEYAALRGADRLISPASVTKLLTALYALTLLSPDEVISPGDELELVQDGSSVAYIKAHHELTVEMLVQGMMIPSGNDAAYVLAAAAGKKLDPSLEGKQAVERFMEGMNEYAVLLGLCSSNFTVPDGLAGDEHYSGVEDMAIVAKHAFENELLCTFGGMERADVIYASGHTNTWVNTNLLIDPDSEFYDPRVICGKTGSLDGYYNVVILAEVAGKRYVVGVFGSPDKDARFEDAIRIMDAIAEKNGSGNA
ncbi:MAG: serine hydrolase [Clostridia bacterium]|nr:serine hydrolase [Clostridia bacterium]